MCEIDYFEIIFEILSFKLKLHIFLTDMDSPPYCCNTNLINLLQAVHRKADWIALTDLMQQ